jgi:hypothetical protein
MTQKRLLMLAATVLAFGCLGWASQRTGVISDSMCGAKHATASAEAAQCVAKCVSGGSKYVLVGRGKKVYQLDPQDKISSDMAGKKVVVTGTIKGDTITVESVKEAPAAKSKAKAKAKASSSGR